MERITSDQPAIPLDDDCAIYVRIDPTCVGPDGNYYRGILSQKIDRSEKLADDESNESTDFFPDFNKFKEAIAETDDPVDLIALDNLIITTYFETFKKQPWIADLSNEIAKNFYEQYRILRRLINEKNPNLVHFVTQANSNRQE